MGGFTVPGGSTVQPAQVAYRAVSLTASITLVWPNQSQSATDYAARVMNVTASAPGFTMSLPPANQVSPGFDIIIANVGANTFNVCVNSGVTLITVAPGTVYYLNLTDNSSTDGVWYSFLFGSGGSSLSAGSAANSAYDIVAIGQYLHANHAVTTTSSSPVTISSDSVTNRGQTFEWTGAAGVVNLPLSSSAGNGFYFNLINWGTGSLVLTPTGGDTVDTGSTQTLQPGNACMVISGSAGSWFTLGRGMAQNFNFTEAVISVTGGTLTESLTQAQNVVQKFTGTLTTNQIVTLPAILQVYYIQNATSGAFTFTVGAAGGGSTVAIPSGQNMIVFSDGTNVVNASNAQIGALSSITLAVGSQSSPSLNFTGDITTGLFQPVAGSLAITLSGVEKYRFTATGFTAAAFVPNGSATPVNGVYLPSANTVGVAANSTLALSVTASAVTAAAGSPFTGPGTGLTGTAAALSIGGNAATATSAGSSTSATTATNLAGGANGGLPYQTGSGATTTLAIGATNQQLRVVGGIPSWVYDFIPQNIQSAAYTLVLSDQGGEIFHPSADTTARVWTIPANASVAFPVGTCVTFTNQNAAGTLTIAITTDTLRLAGPGTTGSRTLTANGIATAKKVTATEWLITGTNLT